MIEVGKYNILNVVNESEAGILLDAGDLGELLLPKNEVLDNSEGSDKCEVFLYYDAKESVIATTKTPYGCVGEFAYLKVIDVTEIGAFLDWGLPKDLFVPISEQQSVMEKNDYYIIFIYKDSQRNRLVGSSRYEKYLSKDLAKFELNEKVTLLIAHESELGINAIINNSHLGLLYFDEVFQQLEYGQRIDAYIKKMREDNKIDLSLEKQGYVKKDDLEEKIIILLNENNGEIKITDKSSPEKIYELFGVSKKKYKMALRSLYKTKRIEINTDVIRLTEGNKS